MVLIGVLKISRLTIPKDGMMFLPNIDAVTFHGFRSILQHEVRYPLAEALNSVLAFFLTLSDHGEEDR